MQKTIERHESLRAVISADGNTVTFKKDLSIEIPLVDLSSSTNRDVELEKFIRNEMNQAFELTHGPLARIHVIKLDEKKHQDAADFISIVKKNADIDLEKLAKLGEIVYNGGGQEILELVRRVRAGEKLEI